MVEDGMALQHTLPDPIFLGNSYKTAQTAKSKRDSTETEDFPHLTDKPEVVTHEEQFEFAAKAKAA